MKHILILCLAFSAQASFAQSGALPLEALLPEQNKLADVYQLGFDVETQKLAQKLQKSLNANPDLTRELLSRSRPGEPLPYDERIGLSQDEYDKLVEGVRHIQFTPVGLTDLTFKREGNGDVVIRSSSSEALKSGVTIKQSNHALEFSEPHIVIQEPRFFANTSDQSGQSGRFGWSESKLDVQTGEGHRVDFNLTRKADKQCLLALSMKVLKAGELVSDESRYLQYACP